MIFKKIGNMEDVEVICHYLLRIYFANLKKPSSRTVYDHVAKEITNYVPIPFPINGPGSSLECVLLAQSQKLVKNEFLKIYSPD